MADMMLERGHLIQGAGEMLGAAKSADTFALAVIRIVQDGMWRQRVIPRTGRMTPEFASFEEFLAADPLDGWGTDIETVRYLCSRNSKALAALDRVAR